MIFVSRSVILVTGASSGFGLMTAKALALAGHRAALPHPRGQHRGLLVWVGLSSTRGGTPPFLCP
jgi:NADP-dependent 3-hydroxy acid dehydrogenase YdfG